MKLRAFIALPTSSAFKEQVSIIQEDLRQSEASVKWESVEKLHLTLKFLGSVEQSHLEKVQERLLEISRETHQFDLCYQEIGGFPSLESPRILWIGILPNDSLTLLSRRTEEACSDLGFPREERSFHPHITFGRVKDRSNLGRLTARAKSINFKPISERCSVILLVRSELLPAGSRYSVLKSFPLPH